MNYLRRKGPGQRKSVLGVVLPRVAVKQPVGGQKGTTAVPAVACGPVSRADRCLFTVVCLNAGLLTFLLIVLPSLTCVT